jgi:hypothetical protein
MNTEGVAACELRTGKAVSVKAKIIINKNTLNKLLFM